MTRDAAESVSLLLSKTKTTMQFEQVFKRFRYYLDWYRDMSEAEKDQTVGKWVKTNIGHYLDALLEIKNIH